MSVAFSEIKRITGIQNAWRNFCVHPDGSVAFLYDSERQSFVEVNLTTGGHTLLATDLSGKVDIRDLIIVTRLSNLFILALVIEKETDNYRTFSFSLNNDEKRLTIIDIQDTAASVNSLPYFTNDESGQIFAMLYYSYWDSTVCYASHIEVDCSGKLKLNILFSKRSFQGQWCAPFIQDSFLYFLPRMPTEGTTKILKTSLINKDSVELETKLDPEIIFWVTQFRYRFWIRPQVVGSNIFYYTLSVSPIWKVEFFLHIDWKRQTWSKFSIDMSDHQLSQIEPKLALAANGFMYFHGHCCLESCNEKAHIYIIPPTSYQSLSNSNQKSISQGSNAMHEKLRKSHQEQEKKDEANKVVDGKIASTSSELYVAAQLPQRRLALETCRLPITREDDVDFKKRLKNNWWWWNALEKSDNGAVLLGEGNFGTIYKCWDAERQRPYVAKKAKFKIESQRSSLNEIKRLQDLNHPRIIEYYGFSFENDCIVMFMEYMPMGSIYAVVKKYGPLEEKIVIKCISQILEGLVYLHEKGVVHNDLKCDNLLLDQNGNIKISDFGLAVQKHLDAENISYTNAKSEILGGGTVFWTAPEYFESGIISRKSDIWSLGCTIVEMMTKKPPYSELKYQCRLIIARAKNLLSYDPGELVPAASEPLKNFLGSLLQISTANRPADAMEATKIFRILFNCTVIYHNWSHLHCIS